MVKGYKVFNPDWTCQGFKYEVGKTYELTGELCICSSGFHFCKKASDCFDYYSFDPNNKVAEVIAHGDVIEYGNKCCTNRIEIVREISWQELLTIVNEGYDNKGLRNTGSYNIGNRNTGHYNAGHYNTGDRNTGNWNVGDRNVGNRNTGNRNAGNWNVGDCNTGSCNTGDRNTGDWNTGSRNAGYYNTGDINVGYRNTGHHNTGHHNTGHHNTGDRNTGSWNTGDYNTGDWNITNYSCGVFCTEPQKILIFDKPSDWTLDDWRNSEACYLLNQIQTVFWIPSDNMTPEERKLHPEHETTGGFLKIIPLVEAAKKWWSKLSEREKRVIRNIPNFDPDKFYAITGIRV